MSDDIKLDVMLEFEEIHIHRVVIHNIKFSHTSGVRILKENKMHPNTIIPTQELMEDDFDRRTCFGERMMDKCNSIIQLEDVMFSDECIFSLIGKIATTGQRKILTEQHTQYPQMVNLWAGIAGNHITGPFFIEGNLNGDHYFALLQNDVIPTFIYFYLYPDPGSTQVPVKTNWFEQNGTPLHYQFNVR